MIESTSASGAISAIVEEEKVKVDAPLYDVSNVIRTMPASSHTKNRVGRVTFENNMSYCRQI
jgi:phosphoglycerate dehydrogenase-like enzyme